MHITAEDILVEIVDPAGRPLPVGESGEIVVTHLATGDFPFIRYRTGDVGALSAAACACGRGLPVLENLEGRATDFVVARDGTVMHGLALIYVVRDLEGVVRFKIIQESLDHTRVLVEPGPGCGEPVARAIVAGMTARLGEGVRIDVEPVECIAAERSGKFRYVVRLAMTASIVRTLLSIVATHSRGAFLGLIMMVGRLLAQSRKKGAVLLLIVLALPAVFVMMREEYFGRMETIQSFQEDRSAMDRINAWRTAFYIALDRPLVGGGCEVFRPLTFVKYAPDPTMYHNPHSIFFEVLGEHGFIGLALFLSLGLGSLITLGGVKRFAAEHEALNWMSDLASLLRVSLVGYATAGAFLGLDYFDFYYTLVAITVALSVLAERYRAEGIPEPAQAAPPGVGSKAARQDRRQLKAKPSLLKQAADWYDKL